MLSWDSDDATFIPINHVLLLKSRPRLFLRLPPCHASAYFPENRHMEKEGECERRLQVVVACCGERIIELNRKIVGLEAENAELKQQLAACQTVKPATAAPLGEVETDDSDFPAELRAETARLTALNVARAEALTLAHDEDGVVSVSSSLYPAEVCWCRIPDRAFPQWCAACRRREQWIAANITYLNPDQQTRLAFH